MPHKPVFVALSPELSVGRERCSIWHASLDRDERPVGRAPQTGEGLVADSASSGRVGPRPDSVLAGPRVNPAFEEALDRLVAAAKQGHSPDSPFFNPSDEWLVSHMRIFQDLAADERAQTLEELKQIASEAEQAASRGKAATRAGPDVVFRLNTGGLAFFSQLGVARRPDLTQYFIDGFHRNRDALAFSEDSQALFAEVIPYIIS